ncbi:MAG TPA: PSD1 and planctomycete cytochrome C domain-containing protein [Bryobacteraceae bacterium]|nr:PSD1 and planctomycete cytochrome C domain-containing protein [Bryobacteraceae bacterium]
MQFHRTLLLGGAICAAAFTTYGETKPALEESAQKILSENCYTCHGQAQTSGLDLRQIGTILKGGKRGPAVIPGKSAESLLYQAVERTGELKMPPGDKAISPQDIATLKEWIDAGAKWPAGGMAAESSWWAFRKPHRPAVPQVADASWVRTPIDAFILQKREAKGLKPAAPASKATLIRRVYYDLTGLPPSPDDVKNFLADSSPHAYEKLIDRLLESPQYGERWGRHWLDVARYADSTGFENDLYYKDAWRYRDYVIQSFNDDKPYNQFVQEQIAADEIWPDDNELEGSYILPKQKQIDLERRVGTELYTIGPMDPSSALDGEQLRYDRLTDMADTTASAFLGLSMGCARCHDHKFDPISQKDYYRFRAIFAGSEPREIPAVDAEKVVIWWKSMNKQMAVDQLKAEVKRLDQQVQKRTGKRKISADAYTAEEKTAREKLIEQIGNAYVSLPPPYPTETVLAHSEIIPDVFVARRGDFRSRGEKVHPGFPTVLSDGKDLPEPERPFVPERRKALALWLTQPDHPLTARVMVNRIWGWHFGRGIVATPNDFGRQGELPTHPELLDWLATEFVAKGWSVKAMQRLILLSSTYQMSDRYNAANAKIDADNRFLWRMNRTRLDAEEIRDAVLKCADSLNPKMGGPPVIPPLSADEVSALGDVSQWPVTLDPKEPLRRSVYMYVKRTFRLPMLESFDEPDSTLSCSRRDVTNVAPQALVLLNSDFVFERAKEFAARLRKQDAENSAAWVMDGWQIALGRPPSEDEKKQALKIFTSRENDRALIKFCLMLYNLNEFIYVD